MSYFENRPEGGFREMLLLDIIRDYRPVYPKNGTWEDTAAMLYAEQPEHMEELKASLERKGWRDPIRLSSQEDMDSDDGEAYVLDGTHRVSLAMREGVISLPVVTSDELPSGDYVPEPYTELTIEYLSGPKITDDQDFELMDLFGSLELNEDIWLNSDLCSSHRSERWSYYYDELQDETHHARLKRVARARLKRHFPEHSFKITVAVDPNEDEEVTGAE